MGKAMVKCNIQKKETTHLLAEKQNSKFFLIINKTEGKGNNLERSYMEADPRIEYIRNCVEAILQCEEIPSSAFETSSLLSFLNNPDTQCVFLGYISSGKQFKIFAPGKAELNKFDQVVYISKTSTVEINSENMAGSITISKIPNSDPMISLFEMIKNIYSPLLVSANSSSNASKLIQPVIDEFQIQLKGLAYGFGKNSELAEVIFGEEK